MTGVSLNPANGVIGTNTLQPNDNSLSQLNGLEALLQQPTFTFEGANPALGSRSTEIPRDNIPDWMPNPSLDVNNTNPRGQTIILGSNEGVNGLTKASIGFRFVSPDGKIDVTAAYPMQTEELLKAFPEIFKEHD